MERPDEITNTMMNSTASSHTDSMTTPPKTNGCKPLDNNRSPQQHMKQRQPDDEFNDCLKLLNQAEQKVQNRIPPGEQQQQQIPLADKYFQRQQENNVNFLNQNTLTYNTINSNGATISSGSHDSSNNSMAFVSNSNSQFQTQQFQQFNSQQDPANKTVNGFHTLTAHNLSMVGNQHNGLGKKYNSTYQVNSGYDVHSGEMVAGNGNGMRPVSDLQKLGIKSLNSM